MTTVDDIRAHGQTIVYAIHELIGHLGIFVSGSVAKKEHDEFASNIDLIDALPPGLYEAVMTPKAQGDQHVDLIGGEYLVRFEARTLDDIRALGYNDEEDERKFACAARVSEINLGLYRTFVQPWVRSWTNDGLAKSMGKLHPLRLQYELFSEANPFLRPLSAFTDHVKDARQPISKDNAFWQAQQQCSDWIETSLNAYRDLCEHTAETMFHTVYGSPVLQALVGLKGSDTHVRGRPGKDPGNIAFVTERIEELKSTVTEGGPREAAVRALLYVRMPEGVVDERVFNLLRRIRKVAGQGLTLSQFKNLVRNQFLMLLLDERRAVDAIPDMLAKDPDAAHGAADDLKRVLDVVEPRTQASKDRAGEVKRLFEDAENGGRRRATSRTKSGFKSIQAARSHAVKGSKHP